MPHSPLPADAWRSPVDRRAAARAASLSFEVVMTSKILSTTVNQELSASMVDGDILSRAWPSELQFLLGGE